MTKLITIVLALVVAIGLFVGFTMPTYDAVQALQEETSTYDQALNRSRELQELRSSLLSRYNTFPGDHLERLQKLLPDHVDNVRLILDLDSLASQYGMTVQNVIISGNESDEASVLGALSSSNGDLYDSLTLEFVTEGTYEDFTDFLSELERSLRIVDIAALSISPYQEEEEAAGEPLYQYNVVLRTYWLR